MAPCNKCPDLVNTTVYQDTPFAPPFLKIPSCHHLTTREEDSPQESHFIALAVIFGVVLFLFLFVFIMSFSPWRKISRRPDYESVGQEEPYKLASSTRRDWPRIVDTHPLNPPRPSFEEEIRKLWESSREKYQRPPARPANTRDSMDLDDFEDVDLATPWKKDQTYSEKTDYEDDVETIGERNWVKQLVRGQGANHKYSDESASSKLTNTKKLA